MYRPVAPIAAALALAGLASCAVPQPALTAATYSNPVLDSDFPDPAVVKAPDGYYYAYATQTERDGRWINLQVARSADLVSWQHLGDALPAKPFWASRTQDFWAPDVHYADGCYFLYYSAKPDAALTDESRGLCLAVATAAQPQGPFTDTGKPLQCGETFVNIDPMAFDDPATGKRLLYWGSGFQPIKVQELAPDRLSFAPGSRPVDLISIVKTEELAEYQKLVEGAWVIRRGGWYYLFYSGDNCCGPRAHYAVMVARSRSATGPFEIAPDKVILEARGIWHAPGHNSTVTDASGRDWIVYHAVDVRRPRTKPTDEVNTRRVMLIDPIVWRDGWPRIEGNGPSSEPQPRPRAP
ncbi:MAG: glycoside hydrolase family 43 protein [Pseudomonadota bacterium]|nr:glycoside hydrolase family 43 protein [Pseudomonadota bacterium]